MKKCILIYLIYFTLFSVNSQDISSDNSSIKDFSNTKRTGNLNLLLIIDVSKSMLKNFKELQNYTYNSIINKVLIDKDYFNYFTFGQIIRPRIEKTLSLPDDMDFLKSEIYSIVPDENFTDIGLALEYLDNIISSKKLPYERTIVFFITDGKNIPPKTSKYSGADIYANGAFKFYSEIKSGDFKVMLLSIGTETAATDLSNPLSGEFIEVSSTLSANDLNEKIKDFIGSIEMNIETSNITKNENKLIINLYSSYNIKKELNIEGINILLDNNRKIAVENVPSKIELSPGEKKRIEIGFNIPDDISSGDHNLSIELKSLNNIVTKSLKENKFNIDESKPSEISNSNFLLLTLAVSAVIILFLILYFLYLYNIISLRISKK
jgi:hypothetical protein